MNTTILWTKRRLRLVELSKVEGKDEEKLTPSDNQKSKQSEKKSEGVRDII